MKKLITLLSIGILVAQLQTVSGDGATRVRGREPERQGDRTTPTPIESAKPQASVAPKEPEAPRTTP